MPESEELDFIHYQQTPKRQAKFITPENALRDKVGYGGLSDDILDKAQALLEESSVEFEPLAKLYFESMTAGIRAAKDSHNVIDDEVLIAGMLYPAMQLKANGGMFQYPLISQIADRLVQFLEVIEEPNIEAVEIVLAFLTTMQAVIAAKITGDGAAHGKSLVDALNKACMRYFNKR